eukprot:CAMPEP_0172535770 /NCGR_PEP_ID=MMETSP1067-20121228/7624_1 /TAXON_ID=265564 ORGANISM="Thalassiosira punctigera, Strain Tpunct2005C2" /NCGR_SAMPLE_ID=MMETSP1067 /ASSEMBLY_ACC=CAM_ASM_000444 /LENGTH=396 /DNA_ID=CAMNT_0013320715 /DNA_START=235 /DNA_END=1425 /DNA_ORIENTATION=-
MARRADLNNRRSYPAIASMQAAFGPVGDMNIRFLRNDDVVLRSNFSSLSAVVANNADAVQNDDGWQGASTPGTIERPRPSALEQADLPAVTPGHCMYVLQRYAANGANLIRQSDFVRLCESSRPGKKKDAKIIATALREFKQYNRFVLQISGCRAAVDGMLRSMIPTWKVQDGRPRVRAAVFVAEQILDERSGMYFAVETVLVDRVLEEMQGGLLEMEENGFDLRVENASEDAEANEGESSGEEKLLRDALRTTGELVRLLVRRKSRPHLDYKKRARRVYLKKLQFSGGPYSSTMQLATHVSLLIGTAANVQEGIVAPWREAWWTKHKKVDPGVLRMIEEASAMELEQQKSAGAAEDGEREGVEDDESDEVDDHGGDDGEEGDPQTDAETEKEKED